jgi:endonuclease/exonuclease/phosphatase family metal-dependent hydrolase
LCLFGCSDPVVSPLPPAPENPFAAYAVGTDTSFEIVTWNMRNFATDAGGAEVALAVQCITALAADIVAAQEIAQSFRFAELVAAMPAYSGHQATSNQYQNLGFLWRDDEVTVTTITEIFINDGLLFPRSPLVADITWRGHDLVLVNNHLKCCGDGVLDRDDPGDEENRRWAACQALATWIESEHPDRAVIVMGDLNDVLTDPPAHNVFEAFYQQPDRFRFADQAVAEGPASGWSWRSGGSYPSSHLDHILVTSQLFAALDADDARCLTLRLDLALDSGVFRQQMSDHVPVALVLPQSAMVWSSGDRSRILSRDLLGAVAGPPAAGGCATALFAR